MSRIKNTIKKLPYIKPVFARLSEVEKENDNLKITNSDLSNQAARLEAELKLYKTYVPTGHFYSPYPDIDHIRKNEKRIFKSMPLTIPGVELNTKKQLKVFEEFAKYYVDMPFKPKKQKGLRYWFDNEAYQYSDAICLYSMIRYLNPKKIIEVGSGYSSCAILDTNELFFNGSIDCTFIDPYPDLLLSLIKEEDKKRITLIPKNLQDVDLAVFESLSSGDILFIDSTHVSKVDSDVNYIFFEILPHLASGVHIHFHDVWYPFEYWPDFIYKGLSWNEAYFVRAFLQYNNAFEIVFFNEYLEKLYPKKFKDKMPLCMKNTGGSIWIKKTQVKLQ